MANKYIQRIDFISSGFKAILKSEGTREVVQETTDRIYQNAVANYEATSYVQTDFAQGFKADVKQKETRWVGFVTTTDEYTAMGEANDKILTRAIT